MLPLLTSHSLVKAYAEKTHDCVACIQGKYIKRPSGWTLPTELPPPLFRLHGNICGPINPLSRAFMYYFVLVDASGNHLEVSLIQTRNMVFPKLLAILLRYIISSLNTPLDIFAWIMRKNLDLMYLRIIVWQWESH